VTRVAVLGAGSWGTTLADLLARKGEEVRLWAYEPEVVEDVPEDDVAVLCVDPGRVRATAPATATLARVTAVVVERTLARPCSLAATARRRPSRCALLMVPFCVPGFGAP